MSILIFSRMTYEVDHEYKKLGHSFGILEILVNTLEVTCFVNSAKVEPQNHTLDIE